MGNEDFSQELLVGLKSLAESSFPKKCPGCNRVYYTVEEFLKETKGISSGQSALNESSKAGCEKVIEVYRDCICGSTLVDFFNDRRDLSKQGVMRRERFGEMLCLLVSRGVEVKTARRELLKVLRGEESEIVNEFWKV